jgi:hypothetical protein
MLFGETVAVYCENRTNKFFVRTAEFLLNMVMHLEQ